MIHFVEFYLRWIGTLAQTAPIGVKWEVEGVLRKLITIPSKAMTALAGINGHRFSLSALGILPNHLRSLLKNEMGECDSALLQLRKAFFWGCYKIWKSRKKLKFLATSSAIWFPRCSG